MFELLLISKIDYENEDDDEDEPSQIIDYQLPITNHQSPITD
jgi:hypothetical protein